MTEEVINITPSSARIAKVAQLIDKIIEHQGVERITDGIRYFELDSPTDIFKWAIEQGHLLHGSPTLFERVEPRQAQDTTRPEGNKNAVYMSNHPEAAMAKTFLGNAAGGYRISKNDDGQTLGLEVYVADLSLLNTVGYMYILDGIACEEMAGGDYLSYKPVAPLAIIKFSLQDFSYPIVEREVGKGF